MHNRPFGWRRSLTGGGPVVIEAPLSGSATIAKGDMLTNNADGYCVRATAHTDRALAVAAADAENGDETVVAFIGRSDVFCYPYVGTPRKPGQTCDCGGPQLIKADGGGAKSFVITEVDVKNNLIYVRLNANAAVDAD